MALIMQLGKRAVAIALALGLLFEAPIYSQPLETVPNPSLPKVQEAPHELSKQQQVLAAILSTMQSFAAFSEPNPQKTALFSHLLQVLKPKATILTLAKLKEQFDKNALKTNDSYNGKRLFLLATAKNVGKSRNDQTILNLAINPESGPFLTITLKNSPENRKDTSFVQEGDPVLLNCLYVSVGAGMMLRECQLERKLVIEVLEQVVDEIELALFGKSTIPMAILNAVIVEHIVKQLSDKQKYPNGAQICLKKDKECINAVAYILFHSKVGQSEEKMVTILHKLGYSQQDIDNLTREISKLEQ